MLTNFPVKICFFPPASQEHRNFWTVIKTNVNKCAHMNQMHKIKIQMKKWKLARNYNQCNRLHRSIDYRIISETKNCVSNYLKFSICISNWYKHFHMFYLIWLKQLESILLSFFAWRAKVAYWCGAVQIFELTVANLFIETVTPSVIDIQHLNISGNSKLFQ